MEPCLFLLQLPDTGYSQTDDEGALLVLKGKFLIFSVLPNSFLLLLYVGEKLKDSDNSEWHACFIQGYDFETDAYRVMNSHGQNKENGHFLLHLSALRKDDYFFDKVSPPSLSYQKYEKIGSHFGIFFFYF